MEEGTASSTVMRETAMFFVIEANAERLFIETFTTASFAIDEDIGRKLISLRIFPCPAKNAQDRERFAKR